MGSFDGKVAFITGAGRGHPVDGGNLVRKGW
jgi:hypothetical protein